MWNSENKGSLSHCKIKQGGDKAFICHDAVFRNRSMKKIEAILLFSLFSLCHNRPQALVKRSPSSGMGSTLKESSAFQSELRMPDSAIRHQNASPSDKGKVTICDGKPGDEDRPKKSSVCKSIEGCQEELLAQVVRKMTSVDVVFMIKSQPLVLPLVLCAVHWAFFYHNRWGHQLQPSS